MFGINITPEWTDQMQDVADRMLTEPGFNRRDYIEAHRSRVGVTHFVMVYGDMVFDEEINMAYQEIYLVCPICRSKDVDDESFDDYGGATSGYTRCNFCLYSTSWADLSAVI